MSPFGPDDLDDAERRRNGARPRKGGKVPHPPGRDEPLTELREWLSNAAGLPPAVRIETIIRPGQEPEDPITIILTNKVAMRCSHQSRLQQGKSLQAFLASSSDGIAIPPYLSPAEVGDFYTALCRMSAAMAHADPVGDLRERLATFVELCETLHGSLNREQRYTTITACRARPPFDKGAAENQTPNKPVLVIDEPDGRQWIRASEWVTWLRFAQGRTIDESRLVAHMAELGSERVDPQAWNADRSRKVHLVFYSVPPET